MSKERGVAGLATVTGDKDQPLRSCFVSMPFQGPFRDVYQLAVKPALVEAGYKPSRADDVFQTGELVSQVYKCVTEADLLLADITGGNPNVLFELGIRFGQNKPVAIISQSAEDVPFDVRNSRIITYRPDAAGIEGLRRGLLRVLPAFSAIPFDADLHDQLGDYPDVSATTARADELARAGRVEEAINLLGSAAAKTETAGRLDSAAALLHRLGSAYQSQGDYELAEAAFRRSLDISERLGEGRGVPETLASLANIYSARGQYSESLEMLHRSIETLRQQGDASDLGASLSNLGTTLAELGRSAEAENIFKEALGALKSASEDEHGRARQAIAQVLNNLGRLYVGMDRWQEAQHILEEASAVYRTLGDRRGQATVLSNMASVALQNEDYAAAIALSEEATAIRHSLGDRVGAAYALTQLGNAHLQGHDLKRATDNLEEALAVFRSVGNRRGEAATAADLARVKLAEQDAEAAARLYSLALGIFDELGLPEAERLREHLGSLVTAAKSDG